MRISASAIGSPEALGLSWGSCYFRGRHELARAGGEAGETRQTGERFHHELPLVWPGSDPLTPCGRQMAAGSSFASRGVSKCKRTRCRGTLLGSSIFECSHLTQRTSDNAQVGDVWQLCGSDTNDRFTWDMAKNDNLEFGNGFQPRARYDRYFGPSPPFDLGAWSLETKAREGTPCSATVG